MKKSLFLPLLLAATIGFYSCSRDAEDLPEVTSDVQYETTLDLETFIKNRVDPSMSQIIPSDLDSIDSLEIKFDSSDRTLKFGNTSAVYSSLSYPGIMNKKEVKTSTLVSSDSSSYYISTSCRTIWGESADSSQNRTDYMLIQYGSAPGDNSYGEFSVETHPANSEIALVNHLIPGSTYARGIGAVPSKNISEFLDNTYEQIAGSPEVVDYHSLESLEWQLENDFPQDFPHGW